ncbi:tRNA-splicing endonuclease subunit Sen54 [Kwoniella heveanensis BCC8398]|uniref:tRNA-splicing endonuclease subunit Sen54 n=1 Tax=Kwoniella heveanensis BCC8398 TaxID=1296120 RepID=A0A1B9GZ42_9TREE|nr:tRNA-splicing endonuclease subunit Sen54 [Kwoniella heveanensis BCC8398]
MSIESPARAGPSRLSPSTPNRKSYSTSQEAEDFGEEGDNPRTNLSAIGGSSDGTGGSVIPSKVSGSNAAGNANDQGGEEGDEDGDDERMDIKLIQSFADKIQHLPSTGDIEGVTSTVKITIPKRGEKDFEPMEETVNLQDMMLQKSREALFNALVGVRGGNSKSISHAIITPSNLFPRLLVVHGHLFDTLGITVRSPSTSSSSLDGKGKGKTSIQLLPEEALYLLERGSLQIWVGRDPETEQEREDGVGEWCEEEYGVKGALEMSVMEGFGTFIGREGLSWERYQAYGYLKRLGYTVQRSRAFIPTHFLSDPSSTSASSLDGRVLNEQDPRLPHFRTWWTNIPRWIGAFFKWIWRGVAKVYGRVSDVGLGMARGGPLKGSLMDGWRGKTYSSIFAHLRIIPAGHSQPLPIQPIPPKPESIYDPLKINPYLPFFHIWKPSTNWTKRAWDKGSEEGLKVQKPDYFAGVVESRNTPLPTINQLSEIFETLPDEPKGPVKKVGPQYQRPPRAPRPQQQQQQQNQSPLHNPRTISRKLLDAVRLGWLLDPVEIKKEPGAPFVNIPQLRNGDRAFVVAVNDSGNTGWIRFGRAGFAESLVI